MERSAVVGVIGKSAPVMTELVKWLIESKGEFVSDVVLLVTDDEEVWKQAELVVSALETSEWSINVHWKDLSFRDISSDSENLKFLEKAAEIIYEQKSKYDSDKIFLNVAGGRKTMGIGLYLLSLFNPIDGVYHVISPQIGLFNEELERNKMKIDEHFRASNLNEFYKSNRDVFDPILFPDLTEFNVIEMPRLFVSSDIIDDLRKVWRSDKKIKRNKLSSMTDNDIYRAKSYGLIQVSGKWVYPTSLGKKVFKFVK
ncbi:MAG: CRISPR-associated protein Csx14 [Petrotogales bacterium]